MERTAAASPMSVDGHEPERPGRPSVRRMVVGASATVMLQGASMGLGFVTSVVLARSLGSGEYGRYVFCIAWAGLLGTIAVLGFDRFLVRGMAVYEVEGKWDLARGLLRRTNELVIATSIVIGLAGVAIALLWLSPSLRWPFCIALVFVPLSALTAVRQGAMQALGKVVVGQMPEYLIRPLVILVTVGALAVVGEGALSATTAVAANIAGLAVACLAGAVLLRRAIPHAVRSSRPGFATQSWLRSALPMMLISGVWAANNYVGTLVVGTLDGTRAAGIYSVVEKGAGLIVVFLVAANMPLAPAVARLHARGDRRGLEYATERIAQVTLLASAPVALAFALFPGIYLGIFGPSFLAGTTALTILALGQLVNAAAGPAGNVLMMTGHERAAVGGIALGLFANLVLGIILVPPLGITGGAIGFASSLVLWNSVLVVLARRRVGVNVTAFRSLAVTRRSRDVG